MFMKLLNFNTSLWWPARLLYRKYPAKLRFDRMISQIIKLQPDIITFQELTDIFLLRRFQQSLSPDYQAVYGSRFIFTKGGFVTFFKPNIFKLSNRLFYPFSYQGRWISTEIVNRGLKKGTLQTSFRHLPTGKNIMLYNIHLAINVADRYDDDLRLVLKKQLLELSELIKQDQKTGDLLLLAGDFNAKFDSRVIQDWLKAVRAKLAIPLGNPTICPSKNPLSNIDVKQDKQVDNILLVGEGKIKQGELEFNRVGEFVSARMVFCQKGEFASDHFGQLAEINC